MINQRATRFSDGLAPLRAITGLIARDYASLASFLVLFVILAVLAPGFLSKTNLLNVVDESAPIGIVACGETLVIIAGGFDLSVGAIFAFSGIVTVAVANGAGWQAGMVFGTIVGLFMGSLNGAFVTIFRVNPFMATLASGLLFLGVTVLVAGGNVLRVDQQVAEFRALGTQGFGSVTYATMLFAAVVAITWILLKFTTIGNLIYAVGGNVEAARLSGVRVNLVRAFTFALCGLSASLAAVLTASRIGTAAPDAGSTLPLSAIAAVAIGGTSILGGDGAIWRTVIGVLLLAFIVNGLNILNVNLYYQSMIQAAIILFAVSVDAWSRRAA